MPTMLEIAVWLAQHGIYVFPLRPGSKGTFRNCKTCHDGLCDPRQCRCLRADQPCHGLLAATIDLDRIHWWWKCCPRANVGINTGLSKLVVLDLDRKDKPPAPAAHDIPTIVADGLAAFDAISAAEGVGWPDTLTVATPSGGRHLYFRCPTGLLVPSDGSGRVGYQIDIRAVGGYVLAPGCAITSPPETVAGTYARISTTIAIAALPESLRGRVTPPAPPAAKRGGVGAPNLAAVCRGDHAASYFRLIWDNELTKVEFQEGERWKLVYNAARRLANLATHDTAPWTETEALGELVAAAVRRRQHTGKPIEEATARRNATRGWQRGTQDSPDCLLGRGSAA